MKIALQKQYIKMEVITFKTNYGEKEKERKKNRKKERNRGKWKEREIKEENKRILELLSFMGRKIHICSFF